MNGSCQDLQTRTQHCLSLQIEILADLGSDLWWKVVRVGVCTVTSPFGSVVRVLARATLNATEREIQSKSMVCIRSIPLLSVDG